MKKENCRTVLGRYSAQGHMAPAWPAVQNGPASPVEAQRCARAWRGQLRLPDRQDVTGVVATSLVGNGGPV
jgi:hypothetical protein